jgi:hypothetical protein
MGNYSFKTTGLPDPVNGIVEGHNFTQGIPHTKIYKGMSGLTFKNCNILNCDVPVGSVIEYCNTGHMEICSHLYPRWAEKGYISSCADDCSHRTIVDTITVDGVAVDTNYTYEDKVVA